MSEAVEHVLPFQLPPTSGPHLPVPPIGAVPPSAPALDDLDTLRAKVSEQAQVIALARTRVETLGAEKRAALEQVIELKAQLAASQQREAALRGRLDSLPAPGDTTLADLLNRVAALEAVVTARVA